MTRTAALTARQQRQRLLLFAIVVLVVFLVVLVVATTQGTSARTGGQAPGPVATLLPSPTSEPTGASSDPPAPGESAPPSDPAPASATAEQTIAMLATLPAAGGRATGYHRDDFGSAWADVDHNGCDTRNDILQRDLLDEALRAGSRCVVATGTLHDPYTATDIAFVRGPGTSDEVQIDHIVPLSWAWGYGANSWDDATRRAFANDPRNLRAVDGSANMAKGDSGPSEWLPANVGFRCDYVEEFVGVLADYRLAVPDADRQAMRTVLATC